MASVNFVRLTEYRADYFDRPICAKILLTGKHAKRDGNRTKLREISTALFTVGSPITAQSALVGKKSVV